MEDITKSHIARLVLGYLKNEDCKIAYKYFYKHCPYLDKYRQKSYKICTRHNGLTLEDILLQYSEIFSIVQARLEDTDYYNNRSSHFMELPQQLIYLLEENPKNKSRSCTPIITSPCSPNETHELEVNSLSSIEKSANLTVNATPLKTLPGNTNENDNLQASRRKSQRTSQSSAHNTETEHEHEESSSGEGDKSKCIENAVKVFTESILADEQLQEKIANTINEARHSDVKESHNYPDSEIDTALKAIYKTQSDSAFDNLLDDILGTASLQGDKGAPKLLAQPSTSNFGTDVVPNEGSTVASTSSKNNCQGDVIVIDSTSFLSQQSMKLNTAMSSNLLMIKQSTPTNSSHVATIDPTKPIYYIGTPQVLTGLTDQDILTMPTVIVCDDRKSEETTTIEQGTQVPEKRLKTLLPVKRQAETLSDYITLYQCNDTTEDECTYDAPVPGPSIVQQQQIEEQPGQSECVTNIDECRTDGSVVQEELSEVVSRSETRTPEQSKVVKVPAPTPRSGNRSSHVRALDFKFQTPAKGHPGTGTSPKTNKGKKSPKASQKSLFGSNSETKKATKPTVPWDLKFRTLLTSDPVFSAQKLPPKTNNNEVETTSSPNENVDSNNSAKGKQQNKKKKPAPKKGKGKSTKTSKKSSKTAKINETTPPIAKQKNKLPQQIAETQIKEEVPGNLNQETSIRLININKKPSYKRKCNLDSKKEVVLALPKEPKIVELTTESDKLVLSPSKLNGNKRTLVEVEGTNVPTTKPESTVTPECTKLEQSVVPPSTAKRNIIPILETPSKDYCPKTPNFFSPASLHDTPFTKVFKEQMSGVDIASMPTPKSLLTPNFALTPLMEAHQSPASNRPTDYSTSSSYYQPSDTEQNKSLEHYIVEECKRMENKQASPIKPASVPSTSEPVVEIVADPATLDKIKNLSNNVIARKNLSLMNKKDETPVNTACSTSCSSGSSSDSTSEDESSDSETEHHCQRGNEAVVQRSRESSQNRYSLRSKSSSAGSLAVVTCTTTTTPTTATTSVSTTVCVDVSNTATSDSKNEISAIVHNVDFVPKLNKVVSKNESATDPQTILLKDLEAKRKRMIESIKNQDAEKTKKPTKPPPKKKKTNTSPTPTATRRTLRSNSSKSKDSDLHLHLSSEDEEIVVQPLEVVETELLCSKSNTPIPEPTIAHAATERVQNVPLINILETALNDAGINSKVESETKLNTENQETEISKIREVEVKWKKIDKPSNSKIANSTSTKKSETKTLKLVVPIKKRAIVVKRPAKKKSASPKKASKAIQENVPEPLNPSKYMKSETLRVVIDNNAKPPDIDKSKTNESNESEIQVAVESITPDSSSSVPAVCAVSIEPENDSQEKKTLKGSTGEAAKNLLVGLKERGIHLMENPKSDEVEDSVSLEEGEIVSGQSDEEVIVTRSNLRAIPRVFKQTEEKIGKCITTINASEDELVYFDIQVFTEAEHVVRTDANNRRKEARDIKDDKLLLSKSLSMTVYDDVNDAEMQKKITVTPFDCIFDYESMINLAITKLKTIKVLDNVLVKKMPRETPLTKLHHSLVCETNSSMKNVKKTQSTSNSPLEDLYKTENNSSKRFKKANAGKVDKVDTKKSDANALIRKFSVDRKDGKPEDGKVTRPAAPSRKQDTTKPDVKQDKKRKADLTDTIDDLDSKKIKIDAKQLLKDVNVDEVLEKLYE